MIPFYLDHLDRYAPLVHNAKEILERNEGVVKFKSRYSCFYPDEVSVEELRSIPKPKKNRLLHKNGL